MLTAVAHCPVCDRVMGTDSSNNNHFVCKCSKCHTVHLIDRKSIKFSAKLAVQHEDYFLAYYKSDSKESRIPGGKMEKSDANIGSTITRELREELGIEILLWDETGSAYTGYFFLDYESGYGWHGTCLIHAQRKDIALVPSMSPVEGGRVRWLPVEHSDWSKFARRHLMFLTHGAR